jgi:phosphate-selective porin OprO/OprP
MSALLLVALSQLASAESAEAGFDGGEAAGQLTPPAPPPAPAHESEAPDAGAPTLALSTTPTPKGFELAVGRGIRVAPVLIADLDARFYGNAEEGQTGFTLARARLGLRASLFDRVEVVIIGRWDGGDPGLFEAYVAAHLPHGISLEAGYARSPLFVSGRDELEAWLPFQERSVTANALWPGRELGVLAAWAPPSLPLQAWFRLSNGTTNPLGNDDNSSVAFDARFDVTLGRQRTGASPDAFTGLRLGVGARYDPDAYDNLGVYGATAGDFIFWRAPIVSGQRVLLESHLIGDLGPLELRAEGGWAKEQRSRDTDGNPLTPREQLASVQSGGVAAELAWRVFGGYRMPAAWPGGTLAFDANGWKAGALELAARVERLWLGVGASDVVAGGTTAFGANARYWSAWGVGMSLGAYGYSFDTAPLETPDRTATWLVLARVTAAIR